MGGSTSPSASDTDTPKYCMIRRISHDISTLKELYKQHTEENEQFTQECRDFERTRAEIQSQTDEDLSHAAALLIQVGEVEQATNTVLAQIKADKAVVAQVRQEIVSSPSESVQ